MAMYKVPQDVEADDKLIGPFSFRQFIYLIIVAIAIGIGWGLAQLFIPLAIIVLPIVVFFGALALPLRKDQPMEIYLAAIVSFYLKPRRRLWQADGIQSLVEITAPKEVEVQRTKDLSQSEARRRLSYLADIVDTGGWAIRGVAMPEAPSAMKTDVYFEAQQTEDVLGDDGGVSRSFDTMISQADDKRRQDAIARMHAPTLAVEPTTEPATFVDPYANLSSTANISPASDPRFNFNPYPSSMRQSVITPLSEQQPVAPQQAPQPAAPIQAPPQAITPQIIQPAPQPVATLENLLQPVASPQSNQEVTKPPTEALPAIKPQPATISEKATSPDIISLANNSDLSIQTIANEANRINKRLQASDDEVVISLR